MAEGFNRTNPFDSQWDLFSKILQMLLKSLKPQSYNKSALFSIVFLFHNCSTELAYRHAYLLISTF